MGKLVTFPEGCFLIYHVGLIILTLSIAGLSLGLNEISCVKIVPPPPNPPAKQNQYKVARSFSQLCMFLIGNSPICAFCSNIRILNYSQQDQNFLLLGEINKVEVWVE